MRAKTVMAYVYTMFLELDFVSLCISYYLNSEYNCTSKRKITYYALTLHNFNK